jgi:GNAT superfamily N-acetyltransferase
MTVHWLVGGLAACGFSTAAPRDWLEGHRWLSDEHWRQVNCKACVAARAWAVDAGVRVIESEQHVAAIWMSALGRGTASADRLPDGRWWISRVVVNPEKVRGAGVGSAMMKKLMETLRGMGCRELWVAPGGYDGDTDRQVRFYAKHGFVLTDGGMVWRQGDG